MSSGGSGLRFDRFRRLSTLRAGASGVVARVMRDVEGQAERLAAMGVTPGADITVLQTFPGIVFTCDQTELAVEPDVARAILVQMSDR